MFHREFLVLLFLGQALGRANGLLGFFGELLEVHGRLPRWAGPNRLALAIPNRACTSRQNTGDAAIRLVDYDLRGLVC